MNATYSKPLTYLLLLSCAYTISTSANHLYEFRGKLKASFPLVSVTPHLLSPFVVSFLFGVFVKVLDRAGWQVGCKSESFSHVRMHSMDLAWWVGYGGVLGGWVISGGCTFTARGLGSEELIPCVRLLYESLMPL